MTMEAIEFAGIQLDGSPAATRALRLRMREQMARLQGITGEPPEDEEQVEPMVVDASEERPEK